MYDDFTKKVRSAAIAGWWTLLIAVIFLTVNWLAYLALMWCKPEWLLCVWGGCDVSWSFVQTTWIWIVGVFKMIVWVFALVVVWLSLWARRLRKLQG